MKQTSKYKFDVCIGKETIEAIQRTVSLMKKGKEQGLHYLRVILDIKNAFSLVWEPKLWELLEDSGNLETYPGTLSNFVENREIQFREWWGRSANAHSILA